MPPRGDHAEEREGLTGVSGYPAGGGARSNWILSRREKRRVGHQDPTRVQAAFVELEPASAGGWARIDTLFLTNRECPWRCLMCDLWRHTLTQSVVPGAIPQQIDEALARLSQGATKVELPSGCDEAEVNVRQLKLYNSGSFFDVGAVPVEDYGAIARRCAGYERVIVENHPSLVNHRVSEFQEALHRECGRKGGSVPGLEIAMGLETVHEGVLDRLNKRFDLGEFRDAAMRLRSSGVALRVFLLAGLPFLSEEESIEWGKRSVEVALELGATVVSWIPLRLGNGALDALAAEGLAAEPRLETLETLHQYGLQVAAGRARIFADLWDLRRFARCETCFAVRQQRLQRMNLTQRWEELPGCVQCGETNMKGGMVP